MEPLYFYIAMCHYPNKPMDHSHDSFLFCQTRLSPRTAGRAPIYVYAAGWVAVSFLYFASERPLMLC